MDPLEGDTHSFIVKIWVERRPLPALWQGQVTHVPSGRRRSFRSLRAMNAFIALYLADAPEVGRSWLGWLNGWKWPPLG
jgi:hypothetical protein